MSVTPRPVSLIVCYPVNMENKFITFMECGELLYGEGFPLRMNGSICRRYIRPAIRYGSEIW